MKLKCVFHILTVKIINSFPFSIPIINDDGQAIYSECKMYVRNYSEIVVYLHSLDPIALKSENSGYFEAINNNSVKNLEIIDCKSGWIYDRRMFPNTVVMEV